LDKGNTTLDIPLRLIQTTYLTPHFLGYSKPGSIVSGLVDAHSRTKLLYAAPYRLVLYTKRTVGKHGTYVVVNNHKFLLEEIQKASFAFVLACRHGENKDTRAAPAPFHFSHANKEISPHSLLIRRISLSLARRPKGVLFQRSKRIKTGFHGRRYYGIRDKPPILL
jgi:hypothetical protein